MFGANRVVSLENKIQEFQQGLDYSVSISYENNEKQKKTYDIHSQELKEAL
jgi:hypothetical protein